MFTSFSFNEFKKYYIFIIDIQIYYFNNFEIWRTNLTNFN